MQTSKFLRSAIAGITLAAASACGIDQGGAPDLVDTADTRAVTVLGPITGFGSIELNGLDLDTSSSVVLIDGAPGAESDLKTGQVVRVIAVVGGESGDFAAHIEYRQNVSGPIDALDAAAGTLGVLSQSVRTNANTSFDLSAGTSLGDLSLGDRVEISGLKDADGSVLATYIGTSGATDPLEVGTAITAVDTAALTFELGNLTVDYSQASVIDLPAGAPEVGQVVDVEGVALAAGGVLAADRIVSLTADPGLFSATDTDTDDPALGGAGAPTGTGLTGNFLGFITSTNLPNTVSLGDVQLSLTASTVVVGGTAGDLQAGQLVRVEGEVTALGEIQADRITIL